MDVEVIYSDNSPRMLNARKAQRVDRENVFKGTETVDQLLSLESVYYMPRERSLTDNVSLYPPIEYGIPKVSCDSAHTRVPDSLD